MKSVSLDDDEINTMMTEGLTLYGNDNKFMFPINKNQTLQLHSNLSIPETPDDDL